jgi:hypothetical protein
MTYSPKAKWLKIEFFLSRTEPSGTFDIKLGDRNDNFQFSMNINYGASCTLFVPLCEQELCKYLHIIDL